ncbi:MAG TPA: hypothetical protein VEL47_01030 [Myxococcota bacterium]|nr:hypothetical protein [Myxococcota bacterium]
MRRLFAIAATIFLATTSIAQTDKPKDFEIPDFFLCYGDDENELTVLSYIASQNALYFVDDNLPYFAMVTVNTISNIFHAHGTYNASDGETRVGLLAETPVDRNKPFDAMVKFSRLRTTKASHGNNEPNRDPVRKTNVTCEIINIFHNNI